MKVVARIIDSKPKKDRRFRNILANSGKVMESGEIRSLDDMYVMGYDAKLYKISDLEKNPDEQTVEYSVKAQADHGSVELDGDSYGVFPTIEKQFGSCKVWLEEDGLHARMYFADNDPLADHAFAISDDASYSIGMDIYPEGYYGNGYEIEQPIGILREISMVLTGNDSRAKTLDHLKAENKVEAKDSEGVAEAVSATDDDKTKGEIEMAKTIDNLTPDEAIAFKNELAAVVDKFTTDVPESETEPTADSVEEAPVVEETPAEEVKEETPAEETKEEGKEEEMAESKDSLTMPVTVIKTADEAKQPAVARVSKADFKKSAEFNSIVRKSLEENGMSMDGLDKVLQKNLAGKIADDITGVPALAPAGQLFVSAFEGADGILSHFRNLNVKSFRAHFMSLGEGEQGRAHGHKAGDLKANQTLADTYRDVLVKMIYKKNPIDATMLYENPQLLNYTDEEIDSLIRREIERAAIVGDGRTYTSGVDYRVFDGTRGFYSIKADAAAQSGAGAAAATTVQIAATDNLYDGVVKARGAIKADGRLIVVAKSSAVSGLLGAKSNNGYLVNPGTSLEQFLGVAAIYTPDWMDNDENVAYVFAENQYGLIGENTINHRNSFDADYNTEVRLGETPRGGSLIAAKAAAAIAIEA